MRNVKTSFDTKLHRRFRPLLLAIALVFALTGCNAFLRLSYRGTFRDQWQHPSQVIFCQGNDEVQRFAPEGPKDPFTDSIGLWTVRWCLQHAQT